MARVTAEDVRKIMDLDDSIEDYHINAFINQANLFVTQILGSDTTLGDDLLKEIPGLKNINAPDEWFCYKHRKKEHV